MTIKSENAALVDNPFEEVARIIKEAADHVENGRTDALLYDINGNKVGSFSLDVPGSDVDDSTI